MKTSAKGLELIKRHEGLRLTAYDDKQPHKTLKAGDTVIGTLTIGYGHTRNVYIGQTITAIEAENFLKSDLSWAEGVVKNRVKVELNQNQFDALVSHVFNTGGSNGLFALVNRNAPKNEVIEFWTTTYITSKGQFMQGLQNRRNEEAEMFFEPSNDSSGWAGLLVLTALAVW